MRQHPCHEPEVIWHTEDQTLTLEGEPVLSYHLTWPELKDAGLGGRWISRYYARLARSWRDRWCKELYWRACLSLAQRRAASRPFTLWSCALEGEVALWQDGVLSLRLRGWEDHGDGKVCRVRWGDVWKVWEGAPCPPDTLFSPRRGWRRRLLEQVRQQGENRQQGGDWCPDPDWKDRLARNLPRDGFCLTPEGVEVSFPQCSIAPAAEGAPVFLVPLETAFTSASTDCPTNP